LTEPLLVSPRMAAPILGIGRDAVYELVREGRLRAVRLGRKILIPVSELEAFVARETSIGVGP
jgi:excisionase family DNA binding protein